MATDPNGLEFNLQKKTQVRAKDWSKEAARGNKSKDKLIIW